MLNSNKISHCGIKDDLIVVHYLKDKLKGMVGNLSPSNLLIWEQALGLLVGQL